MAKVSTYALENYVGGHPPGEVHAPEGLFQLSDAEWHVLFRDSRSGLTCGLLRSTVEVEEAGRRHCRVTISDDADGGFSGSFVLRARADDLRTDLGNRISSLQRSGEVIAAVGEGQWWRDIRVFDTLGWSRTRSIAGVHCRGGEWGKSRIKRSRRARVLDFGPNGVSLRGWRTRVVIPWDSIAAIEVTSGHPVSAAAVPDDRQKFSGVAILLRSHTAQEIVFHTMLSTPSAISAHLSDLIDRLAQAEQRASLRSSSVASGHTVGSTKILPI
jgi:hypothetical protein